MRTALGSRSLILLTVLAVAACSDSPKPKPPSDAATDDRDASPHAADSSTDADAAIPLDPDLPLTQWQSLFDATLSEWYTYLPSHGRNSDPDGVFRIEDGVLHVLGNTPPAGEQEFGYVATRSEYNNYRFRLQQRWGTQKFAPRQDAVRDSGLLYHMVGPDQVWPQSSEFQIQENDVGDLFLLGDVGVTVPLMPGTSDVFQHDGQPTALRSAAVRKGGTYDSLTEWNDLELIASEREYLHSVNRRVNHRGWAFEAKIGDAWVPLDRGRLVLQAEGAEVFYRNAQLRALAYPPPPSGATVLFDGSTLEAWQRASGGDAHWKIVDGVLEADSGAGDLQTRETFGDVRLHLEFRLSAAADADLSEAERARGEVLVQGRYGLLLRDSYGRALSAQTSGAIGTTAPRIYEALPAEVWQSIDLVFRAARWSKDGKRKALNAYVTVVYNGSEIHRALELDEPTANGAIETSAAAPLRLRTDAGKLRYRNIWLERL